MEHDDEADGYVKKVEYCIRIRLYPPLFLATYKKEYICAEEYVKSKYIAFQSKAIQYNTHVSW